MDKYSDTRALTSCDLTPTFCGNAEERDDPSRVAYKKKPQNVLLILSIGHGDCSIFYKHV